MPTEAVTELTMNTADLEASSAFWKELGFEALELPPEADGKAILLTNGALMLLFHKSDDEDLHLTFTVREGLKKTCDLFHLRNIEFFQEPMEGEEGQTLAAVRSPEGLPVVIMELPEE